MHLWLQGLKSNFKLHMVIIKKTSNNTTSFSNPPLSLNPSFNTNENMLLFKGMELIICVVAIIVCELQSNYHFLPDNITNR